jgi:predicted RNase H-like nuclease
VPLYVTGHDGWASLRDQVCAARRKSELRRAEDPVDAVVCAYVALYAARRPADVTIYGDAATGYIVTPSLPAGLSPPPRG